MGFKVVITHHFLANANSQEFPGLGKTQKRHLRRGQDGKSRSYEAGGKR